MLRFVARSGLADLYNRGYGYRQATFSDFFALLAKRGVDVLAAALLLLLMLPVMLTIARVVRRDGGSALYRHTRIGLGGTPFGCLKFRTMVPEADSVLARYLAEHPGSASEWAARRKLADDPRITRIGRFLRATSFDELPQLINVLRGEMSLVGPRPVVAEELNHYYDPASRAAYISVRPGMTGLWQVSGRSHTTYAERVSLDVRYVAERSMAGDIKLMLRTIPAILQRRGAV